MFQWNIVGTSVVGSFAGNSIINTFFLWLLTRKLFGYQYEGFSLADNARKFLQHISRLLDLLRFLNKLKIWTRLPFSLISFFSQAMSLSLFLIKVSLSSFQRRHRLFSFISTPKPKIHLHFRSKSFNNNEYIYLQYPTIYDAELTCICLSAINCEHHFSMCILWFRRCHFPHQIRIQTHTDRQRVR